MKEKLNQLLNTVKENFKKNKVLLLIVSVIWIVLVVVSISSYSPTLGKKSIGNSYSDHVIELTSDVKIEQTSSVIDGTNAFSVKLATYARKNSGNVYIKIENVKDGTVYADRTIKMSSVNDNAFATIELDKTIEGTDKDNILITITSDGTEGSSIGVYYSSVLEVDEEEGLPSATLTINGEQQEDGGLTYKYLTDNDQMHTFYVRLMTWTLIALTFIILFIILVSPKYEVLFTTIILIMGLLFMSVMTPLSQPDEQHHYEVALQMSNMVLNPDENSLMINRRYVDYNHLSGHYNVSGGYYREINDLNIPMELSSHTDEMETDITGSYMLCYIPQTIGVIIGRVFNLNMLKTYYSGKLMNLIFYAACVYIALKKTPCYKFLFGLIYSMPMLIQTASSYSYDNYINGLCIIIIAYFMKFKFVDEKIKPREVIFVLVCCALLAPLKYVYGLLSLIFLFVPKERFSKTWIKWVVVILFVIAGTYKVDYEAGRRVAKHYDDFIDYFVKDKDTDTSDDVTEEASSDEPTYEVTEETTAPEGVTEKVTGEIALPKFEVLPETSDVENTEVTETVEETSGDDTSVSSGENVMDISGSVAEEEYKTFEDIYTTDYFFNHPVEVFQIFARTIRYQIKNWYYSSIGRILAGSTLVLPLTLVHIMCLLPLIAALREEEYTLSVPMKALFLSICLIVGLIIMAGFFVTWTGSGQTVIEDFGGIMVQGIQGRYFSAILPYFFVVFANKKIKIPKKFDKYILFIYVAMMFEVVIYVMSYTFVN